MAHIATRRTGGTAGLIRMGGAAGCASGSDVVAVQRALGHAKPTTTLTTYAHLWPTTEDRVRDAAARLVDEVVRSGEGTVRAEQA